MYVNEVNADEEDIYYVYEPLHVNEINTFQGLEDPDDKTLIYDEMDFLEVIDRTSATNYIYSVMRCDQVCNVELKERERFFPGKMV